MQATEQELTWRELWTKTSWNCPCRYGLETAEIGSIRYYKAWSALPPETGHARLETDVYEAVDDADYTGPTGYGPLNLADRDRYVAKVAAVRAMMTAAQASRSDMEKRAHELRAQAEGIYTEWQRDEEARRARAIDDEEALKHFRYWLRGAALLMQHGTDDERQLLHRLWNAKKA